MQGYVVQNKTLQINGDIEYYGIYRYSSWPLTDFGGENRDVLMTDYLESLFDRTGTYISEDCLELHNYINLCNSEKMALRILFLQTKTDFSDKNNFSFLGYDVIYQFDFFSGIYDVLFGNIPNPMKNSASKLNKNGIFDNYVDALDFLHNIDQCILEGYNMEPSTDFEIVKIFEVVS